MAYIISARWAAFIDFFATHIMGCVIKYNLLEIPVLEYTGYIWLSDQSKPDILENETYDFSKIKQNPFIIEAKLFAEKENVSVNVKHIDGKYIISIIELNNIPENAEIEDKSYLANPALEKKVLIFIN